MEPEIATLTQSIESELARRSRDLEAQCAPLATRSGEPTPRIEHPRGFNLRIDDFVRYMLDEATRDAILTEFDDIVRPLLSAGRKLHIIGHSWGTVVAYEGLRRMDGDSLSGRVANLFVAGSALSIPPVRSNLFGRVTDGRLPARVDRIINLDAAGDVVGGAIGDHFVTHREFLRLDPVGCPEIPFTNIAWNPACAHASYFRSANIEVNKQIFARWINAS
jgi:pimeloyl-ACP methyl ester carboxylesterase